ncbi:MAG TPA: hypothetical protein VGW39_06875 [Chthoniobacterales bacterium]|nr:hypothetical protein [Chthoniobacterales bacterium]
MFSLFRRTPKISAPTIGFLDLTDGEASTELGADRAALNPLFSSSEDSSAEPPRCNVLFLYCRLQADGSIRGSSRSVREIIRDSGAAVVVVATENSAESYIAGANNQRYGHANLVMTLDRRGDLFPKFFQRLFTEMKNGVSMPVAWVKLAPQIPGADHADCPDTIFSCEAGQLAFK